MHRVLVCEPDEKFTKALKLYFRGMNYEPTFTTNFNLAPETKPDVILLAVPASDASRAPVEQVAEWEALRDVPLILMSTAKEVTDVFPDGLTEVGATAYLKKPFIKADLTRVLDAVIAGEPIPDQASASGCAVLFAVVALGYGIARLAI